MRFARVNTETSGGLECRWIERDGYLTRYILKPEIGIVMVLPSRRSPDERSDIRVFCIDMPPATSLPHIAALMRATS
jgi:hypothetical protein